MTDETRPKPVDSAASTEVSPPPGNGGIADRSMVRSMELPDFMEQLGLIMRLPRRGKGKKSSDTSAEPVAKAAVKRSTPAAVWWGPLLLIGVALTLGYFALRPTAGSDPLPSAAVGRWITDDPRYVERGFTLDSASVVFFTGSETADFTRHSIVGTTVRTENGQEHVSLDYVVADGTMTLAFWIEPGAEPIIHFLNQPDIAWKQGFWPGRLGP
ncbi:MAG: hypothetical protein E4H41_07725 [Gemmatimonadales bacterium]|jgi:hypothetical protein|nr:MAG: hypothetical protein E4H41_07725 [Gemmatimonadales bacterium]